MGSGIFTSEKTIDKKLLFFLSDLNSRCFEMTIDEHRKIQEKTRILYYIWLSTKKGEEWINSVYYQFLKKENHFLREWLGTIMYKDLYVDFEELKYAGVRFSIGIKHNENFYPMTNDLDIESSCLWKDLKACGIKSENVFTYKNGKIEYLRVGGLPYLISNINILTENSMDDKFDLVKYLLCDIDSKICDHLFNYDDYKNTSDIYINFCKKYENIFIDFIIYAYNKKKFLPMHKNLCERWYKLLYSLNSPFTTYNDNKGISDDTIFILPAGVPFGTKK
jgi:hypothetical protein